MAKDFNIYDFSRIYRRTILGAGTSGKIVTIKTKPLDPKRLRVLTHITAENVTNSFTKARLLIIHGGLKHYIDEITTVLSSQLVVSRSDVLLGQGDIFAIEFTGTTTGDELRLTLIGWTKDL